MRDLGKNYFEPFDTLYRDVTEQIHRRALTPDYVDGKEWLATLVQEFQAERDAWGKRKDYAHYFDACPNSQHPVVRLITCAYLHISYDLPRVIADQWPGRERWSRYPAELKGEWIFDDLRLVFGEAFVRSARNWRVVGLIAFVTRGIPRDTLQLGALWALELRSKAWRHARILAHVPPPRRAEIEGAILWAMICALKDARLSVVRASHLPPPPNPLFGVVGMPFLLLLSNPLLTIPATVLSVISLVMLLRHRAKKEDAYISHYVAELGALLNDYLPMAIESPQTLNEYIIRRRKLRDQLDPESFETT